MVKNSIAYAAGFFDGEGYVGLGYRLRLEVRVTQTQKRVLDNLKDTWGGGVYPRKIVRGRRPAFDWVLVEHQKVHKFLKDVYPFLQVKKLQVDKTLEFHRCN